MLKTGQWAAVEEDAVFPDSLLDSTIATILRRAIHCLNHTIDYGPLIVDVRRIIICHEVSAMFELHSIRHIERCLSYILYATWKSTS